MASKRLKAPHGSQLAAVVNLPSKSVTAAHASRKTLTAIEKDLGGRGQLIEALEFAGELTEKEMNLLNLLGNPKYKEYALPTLCRRAGVSISQLLKMFQKSMAARTYVQVMERVYGHAVPVVEDVVNRSLMHRVVCPECYGEGTQSDGKKQCPACRGNGTILSDPDWDRQKAVLQMTGALQAGQNIQINNQQVNQKVDMTVLRSTVEFRAATDRLLYPGRERRTSEQQEWEEKEVVEAEATPVEDEPGEPGVAQPEPGDGNPETAERE